MTNKEITCIGCPLGCVMLIEADEHHSLSITGNHCPKGKLYAQEELTHPVRTVTSTVAVIRGNMPVVSVKTVPPVPKDKVMEVIAEIKTLSVFAPIKRGVVIKENIAGTSSHLVATKNVDFLPS